MEIQQRLIEIWNKQNYHDLPEWVMANGSNYAINEEQKDILVTGINPSFRAEEKAGHVCFSFQDVMRQVAEKYDNYWGPVRKILYSSENGVDLISQTAYLDIFYFRKQRQSHLKQILKSSGGVAFIAEQLNLTQHIVEDIIQPRLIIVKNRESAAYWGKLSDRGLVWMGYQFELIESSPYGDWCRIVGLLDSNERIAPEIKETKLLNTLVLFSQHISQFTPKENRPTATYLKEKMDLLFS